MYVALRGPIIKEAMTRDYKCYRAWQAEAPVKEVKDVGNANIPPPPPPTPEQLKAKAEAEAAEAAADAAHEALKPV